MEDIEKLKKIANLSKELKRHGFAASSDEAIRKSEEIYQEKILAPYGMQDAIPKPAQGGSNMEDFESYKRATQTQMKEMQDSLAQVVGKMNEIIKAINDLEQGQKNAVRTNAPSQRAPEPARFTQEQMRSTDDGSRTITPKPEKGSESNQRAGNYTPADVQIDKIFYYGNKK